MPFYKKRPVVIDANQWDGSMQSADVILKWAHAFGAEMSCSYIQDVENVLRIETIEGTMTAQVGDFIIRGVQDEFYPCKPDIFWKTYEEL